CSAVAAALEKRRPPNHRHAVVARSQSEWPWKKLVALPIHQLQEERQETVIQITRSLAAKLRSVFRRCVGRSSGIGPGVHLVTSKDEFKVRLIHPDAAVEYYRLGSYPDEQLTVPLAALTEIEGKRDEPVVLERGGDNIVVARWTDGGIPQSRQY